MGREIQKLTKKIFTLGQAVFKINEELEKNQEILKLAVLAQIQGLEIQDAPELKIRNGKFFLEEIEVLSLNMDKGRFYIAKDNQIWSRVKEHKSFKELVQEVYRIDDNLSQSFLKRIENLTGEYVRDIILKLIPLEGKKSDTWLKKEIKKRAKILAEDLHFGVGSCNIIAPLMKIETNADRIVIGKYAIIRLARYSEKLDYSVGFNSVTGRPDFNYILELHPESIISGRRKEKENFRLLASVILALRLVFGGGVGSEIAHYWMTLDPKKFGQIGQSHPTGESVIAPSRFLQPGIYPSKINTPQIKQVVELIEILRPVVLATPDKTMLTLKRYGQAVEARDPTDSIIDSIIALESIFGSYSKKTIVMASLILSDTEEPDSEIRQLLTSCYEARNKITHGAGIETTEKAAGGNLPEKSEKLVEVVRKCILKTLEYSKNEIKELRQSADEYMPEEE